MIYLTRSEQLELELSCADEEIAKLNAKIDALNAQLAEQKHGASLIFEQAKKCKNANATAMLLSVKNYLFDNYRSMEGVDELWQVADILCGTREALP